MIGNPAVWDLLQMEGPCDLSYLDMMSAQALEQSFLDAAEKSPLINMVLIRATAQIFADSSDTDEAFKWLRDEVTARQKPKSEVRHER